MKKDVAAVVLGTATGLGALLLFLWQAPRVLAAKMIPVELLSEPVRVEIAVDGEPFKTPASLDVSEGAHTFKAPSTGLDLLLEYEFEAWILNGKRASTSPEARLKIEEEANLKALYRLSGAYPAFITLV